MIVIQVHGDETVPDSEVQEDLGATVESMDEVSIVSQQYCKQYL